MSSSRVRPVLPVPRQPHAHVVTKRGAQRGADGGPERGPHGGAERGAERSAERGTEPPTYVKPERLADILDNREPDERAFFAAVHCADERPDGHADESDDGANHRLAVGSLPIQRRG